MVIVYLAEFLPGLAAEPDAAQPPSTAAQEVTETFLRRSALLGISVGSDVAPWTPLGSPGACDAVGEVAAVVVLLEDMGDEQPVMAAASAATAMTLLIQPVRTTQSSWRMLDCISPRSVVPTTTATNRKHQPSEQNQSDTTK